MGTSQIVFGVVIEVLLVTLSVYYFYRQWQTLSRLRAEPALPAEEYQFVRNQAYRRLVGCFLMLLFAGLFLGIFFLEGPLGELAFGGVDRPEGEKRELDPAQKEFVKFYGKYLIVLLLILLVIILLAGYEMFAIRRFSVRHHRKIQEERRAMIERETARLRGGSNGQA